MKGKPSSRLVGHEVSCAEICGTPCCTGGGCSTSSEPCEEDQECAYPNVPSNHFGDIEADCVPSSQLCGGTANKACPTGQYCERYGYFCNDSYCPSHDLCDYANSGGLGVCQPLPAESECLNTDEPVCGCDGVTYATDCARKKANAAWASGGACR